MLMLRLKHYQQKEYLQYTDNRRWGWRGGGFFTQSLFISGCHRTMQFYESISAAAGGSCWWPDVRPGSAERSWWRVPIR